MGARLRRLRRDAALLLRRPHPDLVELSAEDRRFLSALHDTSVPLSPEAKRELRDDNPRLVELHRAYAAHRGPVTGESHWARWVDLQVDLQWFRGESLFLWHRRELPRATVLKFFVFLRYVADRDRLGLLDRLEEDGAFGAWTYEYAGYPRVSRDLLDSVNEVSFLERELEISRHERLRVLDIGAGYGRLAHRMASGLSNLTDYACLDAIPEATFLCEWYLRHRGATPPARVVALDRLDAELEAGGFDLAVNVHSFSECTHAAVEWWSTRLRELRVPRLLVVPNDPTDLLTMETDGSRRDYLPLLEAAGYRLSKREPTIDDPAIRELLAIDDHFHLFTLEG